MNNEIEWLLEETNPLVRYHTLTELLDRPLNDPDVRESLTGMINSPPIHNIFRKQNDDGGFLQETQVKRWGKWAQFGYLPKYKATIWQAHFLAQVNIPKDNSRIQKLGEYLFKTTYDKETGKFGLDIMTCLNSYIIYALCKFGFEKRPEIEKAFNFQVQYQRFDDGEWIPPKKWPYNGEEGHCWGPVSCYVGITQFVRTLTVVPDSLMTKEAAVVKERAITFLLGHGIIRRKWEMKFRKSLPCYRNHRTEPDLNLWAPMTFLLDPIEVTSTLLQLGVPASNVEEAITFILSKRKENNRWVVEKVPSAMYGSWGKKGEENKWVTFRALKMLKLAGRFEETL